MSSDDRPRLEAGPMLAIGPAFIGWSLQLLFSGACFQAAIKHLHPETTSCSAKTRLTLCSVLVLNLVIVGLTFYEIFFWGCLQATSIDQLYQFTIPDAIVSIPGGILGAIVQAFFAERAWKVVNRSKVFVLIAGIAWLAALAGALATATQSLKPQSTAESFYDVLVPTQVWLWASAFTDVCISVVLVSSVFKYRAGFNKSWNQTFTWLMHLAFQTAALTTAFALGASLASLLTYRNDAASVYYAMQYPIPALYTFSYIWSLDIVASAKAAKSASRATSSRCSKCLGPLSESWPYPSGEAQVHSLHYAMSRQEELGGNSLHGIGSFLSPRASCGGRHGRAGKGQKTLFTEVSSGENTEPIPAVHVDTEVYQAVEIKIDDTSIHGS